MDPTVDPVEDPAEDHVYGHPPLGAWTTPRRVPKPRKRGILPVWGVVRGLDLAGREA